MKTFIAKDGELRLYARISASLTSKMYCKVLFSNSDFTAPIGRNRPEEVLVLDRMKFDANTHFVQGSDAAIAEPLPCSFSIRAFDRKGAWEAVNWLLNQRSLGSPAVIPYTTKGTTMLRDYLGANFTTNNFTDTSKLCVNVELKYAADTSDIRTGSNTPRPLLLRLNEVYFNPGEQTINEAEDSLTINMSGMIYGSIDYASADFTTGRQVNA